MISDKPGLVHILTVRKLDDDVHRRVKFEAMVREVSVEEAARQLLDEATQPTIHLGDAIANFNKEKDVRVGASQRPC